MAHYFSSFQSYNLNTKLIKTNTIILVSIIYTDYRYSVRFWKKIILNFITLILISTIVPIHKIKNIINK